MSKLKGFSDVLVRVRKEQGFPSAYAFFHDRGGRDSLGINYRNYVNLESGKSLPKAKTLEAIMLSLGLREYSVAIRDLVEAYFAALGLDRLGRLMRSPQSPLAQANLAEMAARHALGQKRVQLSMAQWKLQAQSFEAYTCDLLLVSTPGGLELSELGRLTGFAPAALKRAVKALVSSGLAKSSGGRVRSAFENKVVEAAPMSPATMGLKAALFAHHSKLMEKSRLARSTVTTVRLTEAGLKEFLRHLDQLIDVAELYNSQDNAEGSAVYMIRGQVFQVFPWPFKGDAGSAV